MGIDGLVIFLEKAINPFNICMYKEAVVGVDAHCLLAKGLAEGLEKNRLVNYSMEYVKMLLSQDIRPILVFNGKRLLSNIEISKQSLGDWDTKGVQEITTMLIKECHEIKVDCIVAPYEAAAQLAFFNLRGIAELVVTQDPNLILFGCSKICFDLNREGFGSLLDSEKICDAIKMRQDTYTFDKFKHMCILNGCNYIQPLEGINLQKAREFVMSIEEPNPEYFLDTIPKVLKMPNIKITQEYKEQFMLTDAIFRHQIIFNPFSRKLEPLFDPHIAGTEPCYCKNAGEIFDHEEAYQIALGNLNPVTLEVINDWDPKKAEVTNKSIWGDGPFVKSPLSGQQKDSFKEYFTNYKFETIEEMDIDESSHEPEEQQKPSFQLMAGPRFDSGIYPERSTRHTPLPPFDETFTRFPSGNIRSFPEDMNSDPFMPTMMPTRMPTRMPTTIPTMMPTRMTTKMPTGVTTRMPTGVPTRMPTGFPTRMPTGVSTGMRPVPWETSHPNEAGLPPAMTVYPFQSKPSPSNKSNENTSPEMVTEPVQSKTVNEASVKTVDNISSLLRNMEVGDSAAISSKEKNQETDK